MLVPGESFTSLHETHGAARKFQDGKKMAALRRQQQQQQQQQQEGMGAPQGVSAEEQARIDEVFEQYRVLRGPTLLEQHAAKQQGKGGGRGGRGSFSFDHERDVASHRTHVGGAEARKLVEDAKKLDSRFDRAVQR